VGRKEQVRLTGIFGLAGASAKQLHQSQFRGNVLLNADCEIKHVFNVTGESSWQVLANEVPKIVSTRMLIRRPLIFGMLKNGQHVSLHVRCCGCGCCCCLSAWHALLMRSSNLVILPPFFAWVEGTKPDAVATLGLSLLSKGVEGGDGSSSLCIL
jgi:hypothetical protein